MLQFEMQKQGQLFGKSQSDKDLKYEAPSQNHESTLSPAWSLRSR